MSDPFWYEKGHVKYCINFFRPFKTNDTINNVTGLVQSPIPRRDPRGSTANADHCEIEHLTS